jgi:hypothetical protein
MADEDLLAGAPPSDDNQPPADDQTPPAGAELDAGPPPSDVKYPDWVPSDLHAPEKRQELLDALGVKPGSDVPSERPEFLPEKFWKDGEGPQLEAMSKSYSELERKLHESGKLPPETYEVKPPEGLDLPDDAPMLGDEDMEVFRELGLDNAGAQKLTDHFYKTILPVIGQAKAETELATLAGNWDMKVGEGGELPTEMKQRLGKIRDWADKNLPGEVSQHLRKSASGIQALYGMMQQGLAMPGSDTGGSGRSREELEQIMASDDYWNESNEALRKEVDQEFARLYPGA